MSTPNNIIPIVYLIDTFTKGSGTENQLQITINNLDRNKFLPYLFVLKDIEQKHISEIKCVVAPLGVTKLLSFKTISILWSFVKFLKEKQISILQIFFQDSNIFGVIAGRLAGISKIIISRRDMGWWYNTKYLKITNIINKFAKYCLANAEAVKKQVVKFESFTSEQVSVIYNGIAEKEIRNDIISKSDLNIPDNSHVIGIVANLKQIKRLDLFLETASLLNNGFNHFVIVGTGVLEEKLKTSAEQIGLKPYLHFYYTTDKINETIRLFDVAVLTSESEGLSNVLIEYAINEIPTVAFDVGGNNEIIIEGKTGFLIEPFDKIAMADKIKYLLENNDKKDMIGKQAQEYATQKFEIKKMIGLLEDYYAQK